MPINQILVFPYTFRISLDICHDIHSIEIHAVRDLLFPDAKLVEGVKPGQPLHSSYEFKEFLPISQAKLNSKYDAIFLPSQFDSATMIERHPEQADWINKAKQLLNNFAGHIFIIEQDPRPAFTNLYKEWPQAKVLTTHDGYANGAGPLLTENIKFGYRTAALNHGPWFESRVAKKYATVFAANNYDIERKAMLDVYLPQGGANCFTLGKCKDYGLPSLNGFSEADLFTLRHFYSQSQFQLVLYSSYHLKLGFWQTTRLFQAMAWGSLCFLPIAYRNFVPFLPEEFFVTGPDDIENKLSQSQAHLAMQRQVYSKLLNNN